MTAKFSTAYKTEVEAEIMMKDLKGMNPPQRVVVYGNCRSILPVVCVYGSCAAGYNQESVEAIVAQVVSQYSGLLLS